MPKYKDDVRMQQRSSARPRDGRKLRSAGRLARALTAAIACAALVPAGAAAFDHPFIGQFSTITSVAKTVPANGDQNPYGIVTVPQSIGALERGSVLISNFNDQENEQGTGTTLVQISPGGHLSLFAQIKTPPGPCPGGVGLTTALALLPRGFVVVGSLPTSDGKAATAKRGCLIVLDATGRPVETIAAPAINGPWDMTLAGQGQNDQGQQGQDGQAQSATLFVTNVLNGTVKSGETPIDEGTVVRIRLQIPEHGLPKVSGMKVIGEGFPERTDVSALVIGPTGVGLGPEGTLYVADTLGNRIAAIPQASTRQSARGGGGETVAANGFLNSPLGLTIAPNGDVITANAADGNLVETTPVGAEFQPLDTGAGGGGLFGLTLAPHNRGVYFVNDSNNTLGLLH